MNRPTGSGNYSRLRLKGKWGTGKSAILLLHNRALEEVLIECGRVDRVWYLDERSLDIGSLTHLQNQYKKDDQNFLKTLEAIWRAEIIRVYCELLTTLYDYFDKPKGAHWLYIQNINKTGQGVKSLWGMITSVGKIMEVDKVLNNMEKNVSAYFSDKTYDNIQKCLNDIPEEKNILSVAIEPVETPSSAIEKNGLAQPLVVALINVFYSSFSPSINQKIDIRLSLPWHRFELNKLDFPQKISQYIGDISWSKVKLREFINKRIRWEFKRLGRHTKTKSNLDEFSILFESVIKSKHCIPQITEDTFDYILRHTHHRARDVLRVVRHCIEEEADKQGISNDDFLKRGKVSEEIIIETVKKTGRRDTSKLLITEGSRIYPDLNTILDNLYNIKIPFSSKDLKKRFTQNKIDFANAIDILWATGFLGIILYPKNQNVSTLVESQFSDLIGKKYNYHITTSQTLKTCWSFFTYNCDQSPLQLYTTLKNTLDSTHNAIDYELNFTLHPSVFEYFGVTATKDYPIGS